MHTSVATTLHALGLLYAAEGKYEGAQNLIKRALSIYEEKLGYKHPDVANGLNNLGLLYEAEGKHQEAHLFYKRALDIATETLGEQHPYTRLFAKNRERVLSKQ